MNAHMKQWMVTATSGEQTELAITAGTSRGHLYQLSSGERTAGPQLAQRIEAASKMLRKINKKLPILKRSQLCPACGGCEFAKKCGG
jgi:hypothetical protein